MVKLNIVLPNDFLEEEVRCDYKITKNMKEVWAIELDILAKILDVCKKYDIKICSTGGTTLGAIRHNGFIPWDDDIDLEIDRENYEKLCKIGSTEFQYPYFFQTEDTDPGSLRGHIQIRRSDTTGILKSEIEYKKKFNQGIFVDIFPYDNVPNSEVERKKQAKKIMKYKVKAWRLSTNYKQFIVSKSVIKKIIKILYYPLFKLTNMNKDSKYFYDLMEKEAQKFNNVKCDNVGPLTVNPNNAKDYIQKNVFNDVILWDFEFMKIPVPVEYENRLRYKFGNYMVFVKNGSLHGDVLFDTSKSYLEYINK